MPVRGHFDVRCSQGSRERKVFVVEGTDLEISEGSISSEWTTESEADDADNRHLGSRGILVEKQKRRRIQLWRLRHRVDRKLDCSSSESDCSKSGSSRSSSSTSRGSSSSTSGGELGSSKRQRKQVLERWKLEDALRSFPETNDSQGSTLAKMQENSDDAVPILPDSDIPEGGHRRHTSFVPPELRWFDGTKRYRSFALASGFLSVQDINCIHEVAKHSSVREINDRKKYLAFKHRVWRFELPFRSSHPLLYRRLIGLMRHADESKWCRLRAKSSKVYPEIEYIEYDVAVHREPCFIEPHVDNKSAVTLVAMLSPSSAYIGGRSCFRRSDGRKRHRELELQQGDVVVFRGEKLVHWITPVTAGKRIILQIELSRV